jgi:hypothetical protein
MNRIRDETRTPSARGKLYDLGVSAYIVGFAHQVPWNEVVMSSQAKTVEGGLQLYDAWTL